MSQTNTSNALTVDALSAYGKMLLEDRMNKSLLTDLNRPFSRPSIFQPMPMRLPKTEFDRVQIIHKDFAISTNSLKELSPVPKIVLQDPPMFNGYYLKESELCVIRKQVQFRFPRSKGKRIRKKWAKRPQNFKIVREYRCYGLEPQKTIFVPPGFIKKIQKGMEDHAL